MLGTILNYIHLFFLFVPITIYFLKKKYVKPYFKYYVLFALLTPLHWKFFKNKCVFTILTNKIEKSRAKISKNSPFSEIYLRWLYKPLMENIFNLRWNESGIDKMVHIHWILNFILLWYYIFYIY